MPSRCPACASCDAATSPTGGSTITRSVDRHHFVGSSRVKVGFVGAGAGVEHHVRVLGQQADVEVAAVCDLVHQRARTGASALPARAYTEWEKMLAAERLDAVFVCTPPTSHAGPVVAALGQ